MWTDTTRKQFARSQLRLPRSHGGGKRPMLCQSEVAKHNSGGPHASFNQPY